MHDKKKKKKNTALPMKKELCNLISLKIVSFERFKKEKVVQGITMEKKSKVKIQSNKNIHKFVSMRMECLIYNFYFTKFRYYSLDLL